jgi:hypothetical protein
MLLAGPGSITECHKDENGTTSAFHASIMGINEIYIWQNDIKEEDWISVMGVIGLSDKIYKEPHDPELNKTSRQIPRITNVHLEILKEKG